MDTAFWKCTTCKHEWSARIGSRTRQHATCPKCFRALVAHLIERGKLEHTFGAGRGGYLYVIDGRLSLDGEPLRTGDAAKITGETELGLSTDVGAELILVDVPLEFESVGVWAGD